MENVDPIHILSIDPGVRNTGVSHITVGPSPVKLTSKTPQKLVKHGVTQRVRLYRHHNFSFLKNQKETPGKLFDKKKGKYWPTLISRATKYFMLIDQFLENHTANTTPLILVEQN